MNNNLNFKGSEVLERMNISKVICDHVVGEKHTHGHRICCGVLVILFGVFVARLGVNTYYLIHYLTDATGYLIHGIGSIPIVDWLTKKATMDKGGQS